MITNTKIEMALQMEFTEKETELLRKLLDNPKEVRKSLPEEAEILRVQLQQVLDEFLK